MIVIARFGQSAARACGETNNAVVKAVAKAAAKAARRDGRNAE
jgi:hypothetical protein